LLLDAGEWKSSAKFLQTVTEIDPENADAFCDRGKALVLAGDSAAAIPLFQRSIALLPADPRPHYQLARALEKIGNRDDAQREWQLFADLKKAQPQSGGMASGQTR
jgi:Flp pilus assembly protein TadD